MSHDFWTERLSEWIDDELDSRQALAVEEHVVGCASCRRLAGELKEVRSRAGALRASAPARELWPAIRAEMEAAPPTTVIELSTAGVRPPGPPDRWRRVSLAALPPVAALALLAGWVAGSESGSSEPVVPLELGITDRTATAGVIDPSLTRVTDEMIPPDRAQLLRDLERRVQRETASLPPATMEQLRRNLATIDRALAEALEALSRDPSNSYLRAHAGNGVDRKERLLRGLAEMLETDR